ncbi:MAG: GDP-mannose-dependent alpha-(1-6)-phosphatidylinositol monomannoside mannosyltransferase [Chlamydiae bacterium]|nr:GDP-mannose-dependent alpha-(1-6)-phosphatidylinositol monomannoside mannosyltransferase [Chlamydiota bacterium]
MRVAVVHDWLTVYGGAERVLEQILKLYPDADLYSVIDFFPSDLRSHLLDKKAKTTFIQKIPLSKRLYPYLLPLMPFAIEQLDLSKYDLVISSSYAVAKGVITNPDQLHICYCHSPMRYAWDLQSQYLKKKGDLMARFVFHKMRGWDLRSSFRVDRFIANSHFVARRIEKVYRRKAEVISPPVDLSSFPLQKEKEEYYVTSGRMVTYKKLDLLIKAFRRLPEKKLVVIGDGPLRKKMEKLATKNVEFLGGVSEEVLSEKLGKARAYLFAGVEDFGIAPLEAQSTGTPVIAFGKGGVWETCQDTGHFFVSQTEEGVIDAIRDFEATPSVSPEACRENAERFSIKQFQTQFQNFVERCVNR